MPSIIHPYGGKHASNVLVRSVDKRDRQIWEEKFMQLTSPSLRVWAGPNEHPRSRQSSVISYQRKVQVQLQLQLQLQLQVQWY